MIRVYIHNTPKGLNSEDFLPLQFLCLDALAAPCTVRCQDYPSRAPGNGCHQPHEGTHSSYPRQIRPKSQMTQMRNLQHGHLM
jgi:hypothetical protein